LFIYPVLMVADILLYKTTAVPVGKDQIQHLEITRTIARTFNKRFGFTFIEPKPIITKTCNVMNLSNPKIKMSKSHGIKNYIALTDAPKIIMDKIMKAQTETGISHASKMSPGVNNLFLIMEQFSTTAIYSSYQKAYKNKTIQYKDFKKQLAHDIANYFKKYRHDRKRLLKDPAKIISIFKEGAKAAKKTARNTMSEVNKKLGIN